MKLQERVFEKLFRLAEIEKFDYKERMEYEDSLKVYRERENSVDTAKEEGRAEGKKNESFEDCGRDVQREGTRFKNITIYRLIRRRNHAGTARIAK